MEKASFWGFFHCKSIVLKDHSLIRLDYSIRFEYYYGEDNQFEYIDDNATQNEYMFAE